MSGPFFDGPFFGGGFFAPLGDQPAAEEPLRGGKGDNDRERKRSRKPPPFKPTGLVDRPSQQIVAERLADTHEIALDVAEEVAREFIDPEPTPIAEMSLAEVHREIAALMRIQARTEEEEALLLILLAAYT